MVLSMRFLLVLMLQALGPAVPPAAAGAPAGAASTPSAAAARSPAAFSRLPDCGRRREALPAA